MLDSRAANKHRYHFLWLSVGIGLIGAIVYLTLTSNPIPLPDIKMADKVGHLSAYAVLMGWFGQLYTRKNQLIILAVAFCVMGITLEILQGMGGQRMFEYADMMANALGVMLGLWLTRTFFSGFLHGVERKLGVGI